MPIAFLEADEPFPPLTQALGPDSPAPGLLCAGADLSVDRLVEAYSQGIFPWFSDRQPILWWSPDPRMVLQVDQFKLHPSMRKTIKRWTNDGQHEIRMDHDFASVIRHCAAMPRQRQGGTWIVPEMVEAYIALHRAGRVHSVETWINGELAGGLYCVNLGQMVFGESMFSLHTDASKFALCALVSFCRANGLAAIDCQQNTRHLASLGASEMPRAKFMDLVNTALVLPTPSWQFSPAMWAHMR